MRNQEGNILIESIVSISLILIGLVGVLGLVSSSIRENKDTSMKSAGAYLAAEGIEITKNIIDGDVQSETRTWNETVLGSDNFRTFEVSYDVPGIIEIPGNGSSTVPLVLDKTTGAFRVHIPGDEENETQTPFLRTVSATLFEDLDGINKEIRVVSSVSWPEQGEVQTVSLETIFTNWRND